MSGILAALGYFVKEIIFLVSFVKNNAFPQPLSSDDERKYLQLMAEGDDHARKMLIEHNLRLVAHIAKKFENTVIESEDLISIGTIGLIKAVESFSHGKGTKLSTYASRCIENEILMSLRSSKKTKKDVSLNDAIGQDQEGNEISLMDILKSESADVLDTIQLNLELEKVNKYLEVLDPREKEVIISRFGLGGQKEKTQDVLSKELGISRSYVSRIEKRALMKMYHEFRKEEKGRRKLEGEH
ncbi:RNA polymerase sporulation sigma factor SigK [Mesobacillus foraminis]|uniref:RNA polymerase sporulation-specific sigma factor n=1 Tax=Mesobacillus foraminis TaxID=279826 RepID=A0A4R2B2M6_9BACI|nr:RNA polymerase sporulation sigma factor SigK [Mesobacillus foraminis]TCN19754.1 RNA polymerase sporulation-specific sigma factor [Mesobacillus foraminis]